MGLWDLPPILVTSLGAAVVLAYFSMLMWKENLWSRWAEYSVVGLGIGWTVVITTWDLYTRALVPISEGTIIKIVPVILGLLTYTMFTRQYRWVLRWPIAFIASASLSMHLTGIPIESIIVQIRSIAIPLTTAGGFDLINAIIVIVGTLSVLSYFTFTREHTGPIGYSARLGRIFIMLGLGAGFGQAFISQGTFLLNAFFFLLKDWLQLLT